MPDFVDSLKPNLLSHKIPGLYLGPGAVHPHYNGFSLLNVPGSLCRWLGAPDLPHPSLNIPELDALAEDADQIIVCLIDALALHRFQQWISAVDTTIYPIIRNGHLFPLTSVVPSTTSAALTTLWTGRSPSEHGILGYELFLREYGMVANMITHSPMSISDSSGLLYRAGFDPEHALPVSTLGPHLQQAGVEVHAFLNRAIRYSGLSQMHYSGVALHSFGSMIDLWVSARQLAEQPIERRRLIWCYYGNLDTLSHHFGPDSERAEAEFRAFIYSLQTFFLKPLSSSARRKTRLILLADHGQITTQNNPDYVLSNHPSLLRKLQIMPTGENRLTDLYPRPGQADNLAEYFDQTWGTQFILIPSSHALHSGLFGPGKAAPEAPFRLGNQIAISTDHAYLWWANKPNPLIGRHGGLSQEEMLIPLFALRLD